MIRRAVSTVLVLAGGVRAGVVSGQEAPPPTVRLTRPEAVLVDGFSAVRGLRELPAGQVLVADWIEERVVVVDLDAGTVADRVSAGPGPDEVRLPAGLTAMGDSTLLLDLGNQRLSVLGPDGRIRRSIRADEPGMVGVRGVDGRGGFYYAVPAWAARDAALTDDSVRIVRWDPASGRVEPMAVIQGARSRKDQGPSREMRLPVVGFAPQDAWTALPDGRLVVVRAGGYRVEVTAPDGSVARGPSYAYDGRPVSEADRRAFVESFLASNPMSGRGADGGLGHTPAVEQAQVTRLLRTTEFADVHPPFAPDRVVAGADGRVWVGRPPTPEGLAVYDVFDAGGRRVARVEIPGGRRLVAVGRKGLYVIHEGPLGLQSVERYAAPVVRAP